MRSGDFIDTDMRETLLELVKTSLQNGDTETLMGLQCLDSATNYTGYQLMQSFINVMFVKTIEGFEEAEKIKKELASDTRIHSISLYPAKEQLMKFLEEGYIPIRRIYNALHGLNNYAEHIIKLMNEGLLEAYSTSKNGNPTHLRLTPDVWGSTIQKIRRRGGEETQVFGNAIGKLLGMATRPQGFTSLTPLILCFLGADSNGMVTKEYFLERCCSRIHRPQRFFTNMQERDKTKVKAIRAIIGYKDGKLILNPNGIRAIKRWRDLANRRAISRRRKE